MQQGATIQQGRSIRTGKKYGALIPLLSLPLLGLLVVPLAAFLVRTPPSLLVRYMGDSATTQAIGLSLGTSTAAMVLVVTFGTPLAYLLARRDFRGRTLVDVLIDLPTVLPPAVAGLALLMTFGRRGFLGSRLDEMGIQIAFTPIAVVIAQVFVAAPYYVKSASVGLASVGQQLHDAASIDGATPLQAFRFVTLPFAWRGMVAGATLCWSRALGEFGATIIFAGNYPGRTQTMPLAVYMGFEIDLNRALSLAAILLGISFAILLVVRAILRGR